MLQSSMMFARTTLIFGFVILILILLIFRNPDSWFKDIFNLQLSTNEVSVFESHAPEALIGIPSFFLFEVMFCLKCEKHN